MVREEVSILTQVVSWVRPSAVTHGLDILVVSILTQVVSWVRH